MNKYYTVGEIPPNRRFRVTFFQYDLIKLPTGEIDLTEPQELTVVDLIQLTLCMKPDTLTDSMRPIFKVDMTKVIASFENTFLIEAIDGYVMETYTDCGEVHFAQWFRPENRHRAIAAVQAKMPEIIPEWANTQIVNPDGNKSFTGSDTSTCIADTFFIGYGEKLNSLSKMEVILNADGWLFNDINGDWEYVTG